MMGGLFKRFANSRIPLAAREMRWELEEMSELQHAMVAYQAVTFRLLRLELGLAKAIMSPADHSPDHCKKIYTLIETEYLQTKHQRDQNLHKIRVAQQSVSGGPQNEEEVFMCALAGTKLLMVTVGCRVNANAYDDVKRSWDIVHGSVDGNMDAMAGLIKNSKFKEEIEEQALRVGDSSLSYLEAVLAVPKI